MLVCENYGDFQTSLEVTVCFESSFDSRVNYAKVAEWMRLIFWNQVHHWPGLDYVGRDLDLPFKIRVFLW